jgi:hypothetical protein
MKNEIRDRHSNQTIKQFAESNILEFEIDVVGFHAIVGVGQDSFGLNDRPLDDFIKYCLLTMLNSGAYPLRGDGSKRGIWLKQEQYGTEPDRIVYNIIAEWHAGNDELDYGLWFGPPKFFA